MDSTSPDAGAATPPPAVTAARFRAGTVSPPTTVAVNGGSAIALIAAATWLAVVTPLWIRTVIRLVAAA